MTETLTAEQIGELETLLADTEPHAEYNDALSVGARRDALSEALIGSAPALLAMTKHSLGQTEELDRANQIYGRHLGDALFHQERAEKAEAEATRYREMAVSFARATKAFAPGRFSDLQDKYPDIAALFEESAS